MNNSRYPKVGSRDKRAFDSNYDGAMSQIRLSDEHETSNRNLEFEYEAAQEKRDLYSSQLKIRHTVSAPSEKFRDMSTNYTNASFLPGSRELTPSALNTTRASLNNSAMEVERQRFSQINRNSGKNKHLLNILNKASDFWSGKLGINSQKEPGSYPAQQHHQQHNTVNQYQRGKQLLQQPSQQLLNVKLTRANTDYYPGANNHKIGNFDQGISEIDFGRKSDVNDFALENQPSVSNDDRSTISQQARINLSQPTGGRNNTLYKYLNRYFQGSESKSNAKAPVAQQKFQQEPEQQQNQFQQSHEFSQDRFSEQKHIRDLLANDSSPIDLKAKLSAIRQSSGKKSSLLKKRLEIHHHMLSSSVAQSASEEKPKGKYDRKIWTAEKEQLLKELVVCYEDDWERIAVELQDPQITSEVAFDYYTTKLNPNMRRVRFSAEEDQIIEEYYKLHGPNWKLITEHLPGRTEAMVRNRYYSKIRKLKSQPPNAEGSTSNLPKPQVLVAELQFEDESRPKDADQAALPVEPQQQVHKAEPILEEPSFGGIDFSPMGFKFEYKNPVASFDPISLSNNFLELSLRPDGIEADEKNNQEKRDSLFGDADQFIRLNEGSIKNQSELGFNFLSPIINPLLPVEWEEQSLRLPSNRLLAEDQVSLFKEKYDENKAQKNKSLADGDYCSYLIDFNQEAELGGKLTPDNKSSHSKEDRELPQLQPQLQASAKGEVIPSTRDQSANTNQNETRNIASTLKNTLLSAEMLSGDDAQSKRLFELVNQIKSIETLFNLTRKEISKLQNEFGS